MKDTERLSEVTITRDISGGWKDGVKQAFYKPYLKPTKIFLDYPDTLEMKDRNGNLHVYSITELLDGLKSLAKQTKD